jgi:hypothetical protein
MSEQRAYEGNYILTIRAAADHVETLTNFAVDKIDGKFGEGYAKAHPEFLGLFLRMLSEEHNRAWEELMAGKL